MDGKNVQKESETQIDETASKKSFYNMFGRKIPKSEFVFFTQAILIYIVVMAAIVNLSLPKPEGYKNDDKLWVALLSSSVGYILPNPSLKDLTK